MKTSELAGHALHAWIAKAPGEEAWHGVHDLLARLRSADQTRSDLEIGVSDTMRVLSSHIGK